MEELLDNKEIEAPVLLSQKDEEYFVERLAQILLLQLEYENEHEEKTSRISQTV